MSIKDIKIKNAIITSTSLGYEHGCFSLSLTLDYGRSGQGFGGYTLDSIPNQVPNTRLGSAWGLQFIKEIINVVGVRKYEDLQGKHIRVKANHYKVFEIGNFLNDNWFCPETNKNLEHLK